ncbi:MAG: hypothetical protein EF813_00260 [Methanosarcinales archaeon]|nr:MAG: hypothetical protein EF813_00260 [Methanosarcinales archaeon]
MCKRNKTLKRPGMTAAVLIITIAFAAQASAVYDPEISVCAPDWTITPFDAVIKMEYVDDGIMDLEGEFDLSFNADVVSVVSVTGKKIKTKVIPIEWDFVEGSDNTKIHINFIIPDDTSTRTYGDFVEIRFNSVGDVGEESLLNIAGGSLAYKDGTPVSAKWTDDTVNIGSFDVTVNAPESISTDTFDANIDIADVEDLDSAQLKLSFDPGVMNVTAVKPGKIGGKEIPIEMWCFDKNNTINVISNLPGTSGVSGSGTMMTITFAVIGEAGDSSVLDIVEKSPDTIIVNAEGDTLPTNWIDATVTITSEAPPPNETNTTVYVKNPDDDKLTVHLFIDGVFINYKDVSSGSTNEYSTYKLLEGPHTFTISWYDPDTEKWYETTTEYSVSGEVDLVVINTVKHTNEDNRISARVYVKNNDDDCLDVYLYIDDVYKEYETIEADDTCDYEKDGYEFDEEGVHTFKIKWRDPDTYVEYEKLTRQYIKSEESITMYVDPHTEDNNKISTHVYVKNLDNDRLDVYLYIDESFKDFEDRISSGYTKEFGGSDGYKLTEGNHTFRIEWYDPDTGEEHQTTRECLITGDVASVTIYTENHDKINTHVYVLNLDDDEPDVYLYIDDFFKDFEDRILPGYTREFGGSDGYKLTEGNHTFRIEWYDPDTGNEHQTTRECLITRDVAVTLYTERNDGGEDATVDVTVNAPELVSETFNVTINVTDVTDLCVAQFDLTFDPDVIDVGNVESGMINDRGMPITYRMMEDGRLRMMLFDFDLIVEGGVSGPGYLAKITFDVVGATGDTSAIDFCESDEFTRKLGDVDGDIIDANWYGADVTIGTATSIATSSLELSSSPATATAETQGDAQKAPAGTVSDTASTRDETQEIIAAHNFHSIYTLIECSSHPCL